jgi:uncharacterized protein (DUF4415 family)
MSKTTVTSKSRQIPIRLEFDVIDWLEHQQNGRGLATLAKERLRSAMNADIAKGIYARPKKARNVAKV